MLDTPIQSSLFEEDYLLRELGQVAHVPQIALTELVANAWDAGASRVDVNVPDSIGDFLVVNDDGHGMTPDQFKRRWMTLRYDRLRHQGINVEFPPGRDKQPRKAYGRNGVGRHGLLCFSNEYKVETWRDGILATFIVGTDAGPSPFVIRSEAIGVRKGSGTHISAQVARKLPDATDILTVLATRFMHDPEFAIYVNGKSLLLDELCGKVTEEKLTLTSGRSANVIVIDTTQLNISSLHQGIAFWVRRRLVGSPSWSIGDVAHFDGRTRFAKRYKIIINTEGFEDDIEEDWSGFRQTDPVKELFQKTAQKIIQVANTLSSQIIEESTTDALTQNIDELKSLGQGARLEIAEFTKCIAQTHPTISPDFLAMAVKAVINLEKSKSGLALLQKLSTLPADDADGLNKLLEEWTVKDALRVLDIINDRIKIIEAIHRLANDPNTDELHTLHPLILKSRWLFGPEFESEEYCSNVTLQTIAQKLFNSTDAKFENKNRRPDIIILPDITTYQLIGIQQFNPTEPSLLQMQNILLIELKRGGFEITRAELNQADGYIQDIVSSGIDLGTPHIYAWVVGSKIANNVAREKIIKNEDQQEYGRVRATTFSTLIDTANRRLLKLRDTLSTRYAKMATDNLLDRVLPPELQQHELFINNSQ